MRSYIFTSSERKAIEKFLSGKIKGGDSSVRMVRSRVRTFTDLARDVRLYIRLAEAETAVSA